MTARSTLTQLALTAALALPVTAGAAQATSLIYSDHFSRSDSVDVGNGWSELETRNYDAALYKGAMVLWNSRDAGEPDAAARTGAIDTTGYTDVFAYFAWAPLPHNESGDRLNLSWAETPSPSMYTENAWTQVFSGGQNGQHVDGWNYETAHLGADAAGKVIDLMLWTDVSTHKEGFALDFFKVWGTPVQTAPSPDPQAPAVPLPAGLPLLIGALGGLAWLRRKA